MPTLSIPVEVSSLPLGWYLAAGNTRLHMGDAHVHLIGAPTPNMRLRGPEWMLAVAWRIPVMLSAGTNTFETIEVFAETAGYGFWGALAEALRDWCGEMPDSLRDHLLSEVTPRAQAEARQAVALITVGVEG